MAPRLAEVAEVATAETLDLLKIALAVIAGFGGVVLLSVNHRRQRFAAAAEQLAHERPQVRLAGVYALAGLADDWSEGRQQCVEVLIAYLRLAQSEDRAPGRGEDEVVSTILRTFRDRLARSVNRVPRQLSVPSNHALPKDVDAPAKVTSSNVTADVTSFHQAWFDGTCEFVAAQFDNTVNLTDMWIDEGEVLRCELEDFR